MTDSKTDSKASARAAATKSLVLKRTGIAVAFNPDFSIADTIAAQKAAGKDAGAFALYLAQRVCTFNGEVWTVGQIRERLAGRDYLQLTGELLADEDSEGN